MTTKEQYRYLVVEAPDKGATVDFLDLGTCVHLDVRNLTLSIGVRVVEGEASATWRECEIELPLGDDPLRPTTPHWIAMEESLGGLLARIFRDGGQRAAALGAGAVNAAHLAVASAYSEVDERVRAAYLQGFLDGDAYCRGDAPDFPEELREAAQASWEVRSAPREEDST